MLKCPVCNGEKFYEFAIADAVPDFCGYDVQGFECVNCGHKIFLQPMPQTFSDFDLDDWDNFFKEFISS